MFEEFTDEELKVMKFVLDSFDHGDVAFDLQNIENGCRVFNGMKGILKQEFVKRFYS
jgi:hypothetical protein